MASAAREKTPTEIIEVGVDFTGDLLTGETISSGNCTVTAANSLTDADTTSAIIVGGSKGLSDNVLTVQVTGGTAGDVHVLTFSTGLTNLGNRYEGSLNVVISAVPAVQDWLCDLSDTKRRLGVTDSSDDALLADMIFQASAYFRHRTGRDISFHTYTEDLRPDADDYVSRQRLLLSQYPVVQVDSVSLIDATTDGVESIPVDDVGFTEDGLIWLIEDAWYRFPHTNRIVYRAGYRRVPDDIRGAVENITIWFYRLRTREGLTSERLGDYAYSRRSLSDFPSTKLFELPDELVEGVISRYRDVRLGAIY